jgi:predicted ribosome quality control (RQC) complex YloA/Tae2 family protein
MWLHLKDRPSAHVIIPTQKTQLPQEVIMQAAKLCARFSVDFDGEYEVDHTQRRHVKPKENANCLYVNYKTIKVLIP